MDMNMNKNSAPFRKAVLVGLIAYGMAGSLTSVAEERIHIAGIYPHLAMMNGDHECGIGAVVPWADRLWAITYSPHRARGSDDKLYEITPDLEMIIRPESAGGTPANRNIHKATRQLNIGPYFIDAERNVRVLSPRLAPGRLTGSAAHISDPNRMYTATAQLKYGPVAVKPSSNP
jgi:hypothetical protein